VLLESLLVELMTETEGNEKVISGYVKAMSSSKS